MNRRRSKSKIILGTALKITPVLLAITISGNWVLDKFNLKGEINDWKLMNDLKEFVIQDDNKEEFETIEEVSEVGTIEEETNIELLDNEQEKAYDISYPEIVKLDNEDRISSELFDMDYKYDLIDFEGLKEVNESANAWIYIEGTNIYLPIVQGSDNDFYLHHDILMNESKRGTLFVDCNNNSFENDMQDLSDISIIYGHHMADDTMLSHICNYKKQPYYQNHPFGVLQTSNGDVYKLDFFAGVIVSGETGYQEIYTPDFLDEEQFNAYFANIITNSTFTSDCEVEFGDKIIALMTCSYETNNSRYVLYGRLTKQLKLEQDVGKTLSNK